MPADHKIKVYLLTTKSALADMREEIVEETQILDGTSHEALSLGGHHALFKSLCTANQSFVVKSPSNT